MEKLIIFYCCYVQVNIHKYDIHTFDPKSRYVYYVHNVMSNVRLLSVNVNLSNTGNAQITSFFRLAVAVRQEITKSFLLRAYVRRSKNGRFRHFLGRMRTPSLKFLAVSHVLPGRKYGHLAVIWNPVHQPTYAPVNSAVNPHRWGSWKQQYFSCMHCNCERILRRFIFMTVALTCSTRPARNFHRKRR